MFTDTHQQLMRSVLRDMTMRSEIATEQRTAIRRCCIEASRGAEPEKILIAFKSTLAAAANAEHIPQGIERDTMLAQLVTIFIDELYANRRAKERN